MTEIRMYQKDVPTRDKLSAVEPYQWFFVEIARGKFLGQKLSRDNEPFVDLRTDSSHMEVIFGFDQIDMEFMPKVIHKDTIVTVVESVDFIPWTYNGYGSRHGTKLYKDKRDGTIIVDVTKFDRVDLGRSGNNGLFIVDTRPGVTNDYGDAPKGVWSESGSGSKEYLHPLRKLKINYEI